MSGVDIIGALLTADAALTALVPADRIKGGALPEQAPLPAVLVRSVSLVERPKLRREGTTRVIERVAVAVRANSYAEQRAVMQAVRDACAGFVGAIAGCSAVTVRADGRGPDLRGPGGSFEQSQDFRVAFDA